VKQEGVFEGRAEMEAAMELATDGCVGCWVVGLWDVGWGASDVWAERDPSTQHRAQMLHAMMRRRLQKALVAGDGGGSGGRGVGLGER
jgi:hypothetical protein